MICFMLYPHGFFIREFLVSAPEVKKKYSQNHISVCNETDYFKFSLGTKPCSILVEWAAPYVLIRMVKWYIIVIIVSDIFNLEFTQQMKETLNERFYWVKVSSVCQTWYLKPSPTWATSKLRGLHLTINISNIQKAKLVRQWLAEGVEESKEALVSFNTPLILLPFVYKNKINATCNAFKERLWESVPHYPHDYCILTLSVTAGFLPCLREWPFSEKITLLPLEVFG